MRLRPVAPTVPLEIVTRLGEPELVFGPNVRFRVAASACAVVILALGVILFLMGRAPGLPLAAWVGDKLAVPLVVLGGVVLLGVRFVPLSWVFLCPAGIACARGSAWSAAVWAEVERFEDVSLAGAWVTVTQSRLVLKDGREWGFLADYMAEYGQLVKELRKRLADRDAPSPGHGVPPAGAGPIA